MTIAPAWGAGRMRTLKADAFAFVRAPNQKLLRAFIRRAGTNGVPPNRQTTAVDTTEVETRSAMRVADLPGDPEVEAVYGMEEVFVWLQECPQQVRRTLVWCSMNRVVT
ncbi:hypothetical protein [Bradyrhizobium sp. 170]|uniref:hypothetical protein n=1 Tax=Bradyrhizobium sp. 170 TaxID=2782641 RepID=UPI001FFFAF9A|nr:hypothetical protein [Bradyrhizobium sp. 170]UPK02822.1 hypothetical protein IVB05_35515 [Bradyrhizobium sp. 170]